MIKEINTPDGPKAMLLGYESLKLLAKLQKEQLDEFSMLEKVALSGFNTYEKRQDLPLTQLEQMLGWFDEAGTFLEVQEAITAFSENFTRKESPKA